MSEGMKRNISVVKDVDGNKIVVINDLIFKGKKIAWNDVENILRNMLVSFIVLQKIKKLFL